MGNDPGNYCAAPFVAIRLQQSGGGWGPCCAWRHYDSDPRIGKDAADPFNHPGFDEIRRRMLSGDDIASCRLCNEERRDGLLETLRNEFNARYGRPTEPRLQYVELTFSNLCNLRCRMCSSGASTRWIADEIKLGIRPTPHRETNVAELDIPLKHLRRLRISGGEPLMHQDGIVELLERIRQARGGLGDLEFDMVSNGTIDIEPRLMSLLDECRLIMLQTSIDGLPVVNAYQRTGSDFHDIERRARIYNGMVSGRLRHAISCSLGIFNLDGFTDFVDWVSRELPETDFIIQPIYDPEWQAVHNLPGTVKAMISEEMRGWNPGGRFEQSGFRQTVLNLLSRPSEIGADTILRETARLDDLTGESFAAVQPRMHSAILASLNH